MENPWTGSQRYEGDFRKTIAASEERTLPLQMENYNAGGSRP
jgi:hypothetical protein